MIDITELQRKRSVNDRRTYLLNELYKLRIYQTGTGKDIENVSLADLEQIHINEKCRMTDFIGDGA